MRYRKIKAKFIEAKIYTEVLHNKRIHNSSKKKKINKADIPTIEDCTTNF